MLPCKSVSTTQTEDTVHILPPFIRGFTGLRFRMPHTGNGSSIHGNTGDSGNAAGYTFALIVPTHFLLTRMQRNGDYDIHITEETGSRQLRRHKPPHHFAKVFPPSIFQLMENAAEITPFMVKETRCGMFQRYLPPKHTFHRIVLTKMIVCPGHIHIALHADALFTLLQDSTTHGTLTRKKEMDKRKEPGFNYVFHRIVLKKRQQSNTLHRLVCYNGETSPASFKNNGCSGPLVAMI